MTFAKPNMSLNSVVICIAEVDFYGGKDADDDLMLIVE